MFTSLKRKIILSGSILLAIFSYYFQYSNNTCQNANLLTNNFTFIIVGGGTAGCILAAILSENISNSVLLIEAGTEFNFISKLPPFSPLLQGTSYDWGFLSTVQKWSSRGMYEKKQNIPRGKGLGGSSKINFLVHGYFEQQDVDNWGKMGVEGFNTELFKYYNYLYNFSRNNSHSTKSTKSGTFYKMYTKEMKWRLGKTIEKAINESKVPHVKFCKSFSTIYKASRWTTYDSHLKKSLKRPNLHVICETEVIKVLISDKTAYGVETISNGLVKRYYSKEVILSAGSINTPKLLMLSGIGDRKKLKKLNITVVENLTGVGSNLHDHLNFPLYVSIEKPISLTLKKVLNIKEIFRYFYYKTGVLSKSPIAGVAYSPSNFSIILSAFGSANEKIFQLIGNYKSEVFHKMFPFSGDYSKEGFVFLITCAQPKSRGFVTLKSNNYLDPPLISPNYLQHKYDLECTKNAIKVAEKLINTTSFKKIGAKIHWPNIVQCEHWMQKNNTNAFLECVIRYCSMTGYHPAGTCRIGHPNDPKTVVDKYFRVKNIKNLSIIDASILPTPVSTFPNSIVASIAAYASEIIRNSSH